MVAQATVGERQKSTRRWSPPEPSSVTTNDSCIGRASGLAGVIFYRGRDYALVITLLKFSSPMNRFSRAPFAGVFTRSIQYVSDRLRAVAWQWIGIVATLVVSLLLFAKVGEDVFDHESGAFDGTIRSWMTAHQTPLGMTLFAAITNAGSTVPMVVLAALVAGWLWRYRGRHTAATVVGAAALSTGAFIGIKYIFVRVRPAGALAFLHRASYSFPSGHATVSAAVLISIAYVLWREHLARGLPVVATAMGAILLIGISRMYLDVHWATDVLGGWCLGTLSAAVSASLYQVRHSRRLHGASVHTS